MVVSKSYPSDYLPFLDSARGHERRARRSGSPVDAEIARLMYAEAERLQQEADRHQVSVQAHACVECGATIFPFERQCSACGRASQNVKLGSREVANLLRFFEGYDMNSAAMTQAKRLERQRKKRAKHAEERRTQGLGGRSKPNSVRTWATKLHIANSTLLTHVKRHGSLRAAVEYLRPGAEKSIDNIVSDAKDDF